MLYVMIGSDKVPVPREIEAQGPAAVEGFIETQKARVAVEGGDEPRRARRQREE